MPSVRGEASIVIESTQFAFIWTATEFRGNSVETAPGMVGTAAEELMCTHRSL